MKWLLFAAQVALLGAFTPAYAGTAPQSLTPRLRQFLQIYLADAVADKIPGLERNLTRVSVVNVTWRSKSELLVYMTGPRSCGSGGCELLVLEPYAQTYRILGAIDATKRPIRVLSTSTNGRPDIGVFVQGGGEIDGFSARLRFDGHSYPQSPYEPGVKRISPKAAGTTVIRYGDKEQPLYLP